MRYLRAYPWTWDASFETTSFTSPTGTPLDTRPTLWSSRYYAIARGCYQIRLRVRSKRNPPLIWRSLALRKSPSFHLILLMNKKWPHHLHLSQLHHHCRQPSGCAILPPRTRTRWTTMLDTQRLKLSSAMRG